ncbi:MAG TPA: MFS transporter [Phenylobacterium sp.]|nr:MFS transporter [Phenylobacterium sp.]
MTTPDSAPPRLTFGTKIAYGFGSVAFGVATLGLAPALLQPYLNRVIGIPAIWVGTAIMLTLILDAFIDPAIGRWSDNLRTRWGRRHPLMYVSAPLVAAVMIAFWSSPTEWSPAVAGAYLLGMLILLRFSISLYEIPSSALAPELTADYHQRTNLLSYRYFFGVIGGLGMNIVLYQVFLSPEAGGILNRAGYVQYGVLAAAVMAVSILVSASGTHGHIKRLSRPPERTISTAEAIREVLQTLGNRSLLVVMASGLLGGVSTGMTSALSQYFYLEFWGLQTSHLSYLAMAGVAASVAAVMIGPPASRWLGKRNAMIALFAVSATTSALPLGAALLGLMPSDGSALVLTILLVDIFIATTLGVAGYIIISSMVADVVEDAAVRTGVRSEGLVFAANGLLPKFTAGLGVFAGGLLLTLVNFPTHAAQGAVDEQIMRDLAISYLPISFTLTALAIGVLVFYRIDEATHRRNLENLQDAAATIEETSMEEGHPVVVGAGPG